MSVTCENICETFEMEISSHSQEDQDKAFNEIQQVRDNMSRLRALDGEPFSEYSKGECELFQNQLFKDVNLVCKIPETLALLRDYLQSQTIQH